MTSSSEDTPFTHNDWVLYRNHWSQPYQAHNTTTGDTINTGEFHLDEAKKTLTGPDGNPNPTPGLQGRYTLMPRRTNARARGFEITP